MLWSGCLVINKKLDLAVLIFIRFFLHQVSMKLRSAFKVDCSVDKSGWER